MRNINHTLVLMLFLLLAGFTANAQRKALVEHFTNSRCPICAINNPKFFATFNANADKAIHLAYHPSVPYATCVFYQANKEDNGARQAYYNVVGTPIAFINGKEGSNPLLTTADYVSNYEMKDYFQVEFKKADKTSVSVKITLRDKLPSGDYHLFIALSENKVDLATPNDEKEHYNVFRDFISPNTGQSLNIPADASAGYSTEMTFTYSYPDNWDQSKFSITAFIQEYGSRSIFDAERTSIGTLNVNYYEYSVDPDILLYPNPAKDIVNLEWKNPAFKPDRVSIYSEDGRLVQTGFVIVRNTSCSINLNQLITGSYYLHIYSTRSNDRAYARFFVN